MYYLYILRCADGTLYTGITVDLERRIREHNLSAPGTRTKGAKYTRSRGPVTLVYSRKYQNRSLASREEARIKSLTREAKLRLIASKAAKTAQKK